MKKLALFLALAPLSAFAVSTYDYATVESVTPQVQQVRERGQCRQVQVREDQVVEANNGVGGSIVGGIVGGLLGNQVGGGSGRHAATAAGAIAGAIIGGNMERSGPSVQPVYTTREVCDPDRYTSVVTGYLVTYDYKGQRGTVVMPRDPGHAIEMRVTAEPVIR